MKKRKTSESVFTKEGNLAGMLAAKLAKQREEQEKTFTEQKQKLQDGASQNIVKDMDSKFRKEVLDSGASLSVYGLKTREEFMEAQQEMADKQRKTDGADQEMSKKRKKEAKKKHKKKEKERKKMKATLTFLDEEEGNDDDDEEEEEEIVDQIALKNLKNPDVDTEFLPDRERDEARERERKKQQEEWEKEQERLKKQDLKVVFSFYDGQSYNRQIVVKKGNTIGEFLDKARINLIKIFPHMKNVSTDTLMYIKEDLIIPHFVTFYDLILSKHHSKSGCLFKFDVHDDIKIGNDIRVARNDSHAGKIVEKSWYDLNKHIFPASIWKIFDPTEQKT